MTVEKKRFQVYRHLPKALGIILFGILLLSSDLMAFGQALRDVSPVLVIVALPLTWVALLAKAERWRQILGDRNIFIDARTAAIFYLAGVFWGSVTPGRVGELARVGYLTRRNVNVVSATASVVLDRLIDLITLGALAAYSIIRMWTTVDSDLYQMVSATVAIGVAIVIVLLITVRLVPAFAQHQVISRVRQFIDKVVREITTLSSSAWLRALVLTALSWAFFMASRLVLAWALDLHPVPWFLFGAVAAAGLLSLLPVTILGIGTRDFALVVLLAADGIQAEHAIALSTLILAVIMINTALSWLVHMLVEHLD